jgi:hypothetical protein
MGMPGETSVRLLGSRALAGVIQIGDLAVLGKSLDLPFRAGGASAVGVWPRTDQSQRWMRARIACPPTCDVSRVSRIQIIGDAGVVGAVAAFDQIQAPGAIADGQDVLVSSS